MKEALPTRRGFFAAGAIAAARLGRGQEVHRRTPDEALHDLMEGNARFVAGNPATPRRTPADFARVTQGQTPDAVIVGCSDSRVPPELFFDQGVGDLFVIRVAGNVVNGGGAVVKGSITYGVLELGSSLIMVLGHSGCGAVKAALAPKSGAKPLPKPIADLVGLVQTGSQTDLDKAIISNVKAGVERLKDFEPSITKLIVSNKLKVVGAVYDLASGRVTVVG